MTSRLSLTDVQKAFGLTKVLHRVAPSGDFEYRPASHAAVFAVCDYPQSCVESTV
jgi:hypothetical protein